MSRDTSTRVAAIQQDIRARMTPTERIELAFEMAVVAREFAFARIRKQNPDWSPAEVIEAYVREMSSRQ